MRNFFRTEWAKLKPMNFTDKRQYIWEYYKLQIIAIAFGIIAIVYLINTMIINPPPRDYLYLAWQGNIIHTDPLEELGERLTVITENPDRYNVAVRSYLLTGEPQMDQAIITRFFAIMHVGDLHGILTTGANLVGLAEEGIINPVHDLLTYVEEINPELHDYLALRAPLITFVPDIADHDGTVVTDNMGISLHGSPLLYELGIPTGDLYLTITSVSDRYYELAKALVVMFEGFDEEETA